MREKFWAYIQEECLAAVALILIAAIGLAVLHAERNHTVTYSTASTATGK
jgi:hypothetical protein